MAENRSLHVHVETYIFEVSRIDDMALTMTFELYMDFMWEETRLKENAIYKTLSSIPGASP